MNVKNGRGILEYEDELLAALEKARETGPSGKTNEPFTVTQPEARKIFNLSRRQTRAILNEMCDSGVLRRQRIGRVNDWGDYNHVPGYKYIGAS